jgi:hypothetical protein
MTNDTSRVLYHEVHLLGNILAVNRSGIKMTLSLQTLNKQELFASAKLKGKAV